MRLRGSPHEQRCIGCGVGPDLEVEIAAGTLKNGPDVYCIDDSEIMRELQCVSQLRWEYWSVCVVSGYTHEDMGEMSLLKMPRSVGRLILEVGLGIGRRTIVMDYVGCARTVQVTPVEGARSRSLLLVERLGIRKVTTKVPRSSRTDVGNVVGRSSVM